MNMSQSGVISLFELWFLFLVVNMFALHFVL